MAWYGERYNDPNSTSCSGDNMWQCPQCGLWIWGDGHECVYCNDVKNTKEDRIIELLESIHKMLLKESLHDYQAIWKRMADM